MAEPQAHSQPIETYGLAPHNRNIWPSAHNRNIWPYNSQAAAAPSRLADSFVLQLVVYPLLRLHTIPYKTNTRCFTVRLAGPKLWNAIITDTRDKCSLNAFKTAYKNN